MIQGQQIAWKISLGLLLLNLMTFIFLIEQLILSRNIVKKIIRFKIVYFLLIIPFSVFFILAYFQEKRFLLNPGQIIIGNELSTLLLVYAFWGGVYVLLFIANLVLIKKLEKLIGKKEED